MAKRHMERCSISLLIRKMQIKPTMRYHLTIVRITIIKKTTNNKCQQGCREKGTFVHCWWECKLVQPQQKMVWRFFKKLKMELSYYPAIPLLGVYPKKRKTLIGKDIYTPMFIAALLTTAKIQKQPKCTWVDEWIKKVWHII